MTDAHSANPRRHADRHRILACLQPPLARRLLGLAPEAQHVGCIAQLERGIVLGGAEIVVIDPTMVPPPSMDTLVRLCRWDSSVRFIIYTALTPGVIPSIMRLATVGVTDVILYDHDDDPARFDSVLDDVSSRRPTELLLHLIAEPLDALPQEIRRAVVNMARDAARPWTVEDLARSAGVSSRALYRHLTRAGFPSARLLIVAFRIIRAHVMMLASRVPISALAERLCYRDADALAEHYRELLHCAPTEARYGLDMDEVVKRVATHVTAVGCGTALADNENDSVAVPCLGRE